jgi:hypothetical protein
MLLWYMFRGGKWPYYHLLSNDIGIVICFDFEGAVAGPEIDRVGDASHATLVDLSGQLANMRHVVCLSPSSHYHFCRFGSCYGEFKFGILLPIAKEQGELGQEAVVDISCGCYGLWTRIPVYASLERLSCADQFLPRLEIIWVFKLLNMLATHRDDRTMTIVPLTTSVFSFFSSALSSSFPPKASIVGRGGRAPKLHDLGREQFWEGNRRSQKGSSLSKQVLRVRGWEMKSEKVF